MSDHSPSEPGKLQRQKRLEEQLKANLKRRKEQARARRGPAGDGTGDFAAEDNTSTPPGVDFPPAKP